MRGLVFKDVFVMSRILKKLNIKPDLTADMSQEQVGIQIMTQVAENLGNAEKEVTSFLADLKGVDTERLANYSFEETFALIEEFKNHPQVSDFLQRAFKLTK